MKKTLAFTIVMLFFCAGVAGATDFTLTGSYFARGTWFDNKEGTAIDSVNSKNQFGVYDHELSLDANWQISPATKVFARFEIRDEDWAVAGSPTESTFAGSETDDNIAVEHVWGQHDFVNSKTRIKVGLMGSRAWATNFGNDPKEAYRVFVGKLTPFGYMAAFTEKPQTTNPFVPSESLEEDSDTDTYWIGLQTKIFDINLLPSFNYTQVENRFADFELFYVDIGLNGTFNNMGFEAEFVYGNYNYDAPSSDYSVWGAYANVWTQLNALKAGALVAYGSFDDDTNKAFEFGDDFEAGGALLLGDELLMYDSSGGSSYDDLQGVTLLAAYLSYTASEKLTLGAYIGYADSNVDIAGNKYDGATAWEINVTGEYKLTSNVVYSVGAATAQIEYGNNDPDPDKAVEIFHKLTFSF